mmetsp:Transcript_16969/g.56196  ORF Transcript_16969/g.56196 Transcript_16969/m.56196 type:complete len:233 (-) Transcript_16969:311-1009(-)
MFVKNTKQLLNSNFSKNFYKNLYVDGKIHHGFLNQFHFSSESLINLSFLIPLSLKYKIILNIITKIFYSLNVFKLLLNNKTSEKFIGILFLFNPNFEIFLLNNKNVKNLEIENNLLSNLITVFSYCNNTKLFLQIIKRKFSNSKFTIAIDCSIFTKLNFIFIYFYKFTILSNRNLLIKIIKNLRKLLKNGKLRLVIYEIQQNPKNDGFYEFFHFINDNSILNKFDDPFEEFT